MSEYRRRAILNGAGLLGAAVLTGCVANGTRLATTGKTQRYTSFRPGQEWLDTAGQPIQAHAGSMIFVDSTYYWYGENKQFTTGQTSIESWGIRFYSSKDLYNWTDLGHIPINRIPKSAAI